MIAVFLLMILGCNSPSPPVVPLSQTPAQTSRPPSPITRQPLLDSGWLLLTPGFEQRTIEILEDGFTQSRETIYILRLDPALYRFEVGYQPGEPQTINAWQQASGAAVIMNANFFTPEWIATGLIISEGQAFGQSYGDFAGMVAIQDGTPTVRSLAQQPFDGAEVLSGAVQAFPMLIVDGQPAVTAANEATDRRSVVGQDNQGRIILLATSKGFFTLAALSSYLANSDLDLHMALNLDGGSSTGLIWQAEPGAQFVGVRPITPLPAVLLVYPRSTG